MAQMGENAQILIGISASAKEAPTGLILKQILLKKRDFTPERPPLKTRLRIDIL